MSCSAKKMLPLVSVMALGAVAFGVALWVYTPTLFARAVPRFLNERIASFIVVDQAEFTRSPPELILSGVHLQNPAAFGAGDAVTIGRVNVVFDDYSRSPYHIHSLTFQQIAGKQIIRDGHDNFSALHDILMDRKLQTPRGELARKVVLKNFILHDVRVTNEAGTVTTPLAEKRLTPQGAMANQPPLQTVIVDVLGTILEQQQSGTTVLAVEDLADKAGKTVRSIGDSLKEFLTTP